jgi:hypothetical protein
MILRTRKRKILALLAALLLTYGVTFAFALQVRHLGSKSRPPVVLAYFTPEAGWNRALYVAYRPLVGCYAYWAQLRGLRLEFVTDPGLLRFLATDEPLGAVGAATGPGGTEPAPLPG